MADRKVDEVNITTFLQKHFDSQEATEFRILAKLYTLAKESHVSIALLIPLFEAIISVVSPKDSSAGQITIHYGTHKGEKTFSIEVIKKGNVSVDLVEVIEKLDKIDI